MTTKCTIVPGKYHLNIKSNSWRTSKGKETDIYKALPTQKVNITWWSFQPEPKEGQPQGKNKIIDQIWLIQMLCANFTAVSKTSPYKTNAPVRTSLIINEVLTGAFVL